MSFQWSLHQEGYQEHHSTDQLSDWQKASKIKYCPAVQMVVDPVCQVNSSFIVLPHPSNPMVGERKQKCSLGWSGASGACQFHPRGLGWWPGGEVYSRQFASPSGWTRYLLQIGWGSGTVLGWKSCFWARLVHITDQMCSRILAWNLGSNIRQSSRPWIWRCRRRRRRTIHLRHRYFEGLLFTSTIQEQFSGWVKVPTEDNISIIMSYLPNLSISCNVLYIWTIIFQDSFLWTTLFQGSLQWTIILQDSLDAGRIRRVLENRRREVILRQVLSQSSIHLNPSQSLGRYCLNPNPRNSLPSLEVNKTQCTAVTST